MEVYNHALFRSINGPSGAFGDAGESFRSLYARLLSRRASLLLYQIEAY